METTKQHTFLWPAITDYVQLSCYKVFLSMSPLMHGCLFKLRPNKYNYIILNRIHIHGLYLYFRKKMPNFQIETI